MYSVYGNGVPTNSSMWELWGRGLTAALPDRESVAYFLNKSAPNFSQVCFYPPERNCRIRPVKFSCYIQVWHWGLNHFWVICPTQLQSISKCLKNRIVQLLLNLQLWLDVEYSMHSTIAVLWGSQPTFFKQFWNRIILK